jgi:NADPH:quinone reductase-like Zn-dependent oxidoreductase
MRAVVQDGYGPPDRVLSMTTVEQPEFGADEVLVRMRATSVNTPDWITVTGVPYALRLRFGLRQPRTPVRGTDIAGVVEAVGRNVTDLAPGDEVFGSGWAHNDLATVGTFAEYTVAPANQLVRKPEGVSFEEAAGAVMSGITALTAMRDVAELRPGMSVLINGASGGVGTFAVQIAKAYGCEVTGVCSTSNLDLVHGLGADHVIDYTAEDFTRGDRRYDVIFDNVLNHRPTAVRRALAPGGIFIPNSVGTTGGLFAGLPRAGRAALMGVGGTRVSFVKITIGRETLTDLARPLESRKIETVVDRVYPLEEAHRAVERMLSHRARGQLIVATA